MPRLYYANSNDSCAWRNITLPEKYSLFVNTKLELEVLDETDNDIKLYFNCGYCWDHNIKELSEEEFIFEFIDSIVQSGDYECVDNYRYYKIGDKEQESVYKMNKFNGCCGFYDKEHTIDDDQYMIGFNYGH